MRRIIHVAVLAALLSACAGCGATAAARLQDHFGLCHVGSDEDIAAELERKLPLGTAAAGVIEFLVESGIGDDPLSWYYTAPEGGAVGCRIGFDKNCFALVHEHYWIGFHLDEERRLSGVEVKTWYTGL